MKRCLDVTGGLIGCILTGILCIFLAPAIYIQSPGPIFFSQIRVGKNGKQFRLYKFRSMVTNAEELMARFVRGDRSRHTEGSGLGLSIAQSLTELQGGTFRLEIDGDLFKAVVTFPREQTELVQA